MVAFARALSPFVGRGRVESSKAGPKMGCEALSSALWKMVVEHCVPLAFKIYLRVRIAFVAAQAGARVHANGQVIPDPESKPIFQEH